MTMASILQFIWPLPDKGLPSASTGSRRRRCSCGGPRTASSHPAYGDDFAAAIPGARLELVDGAGHLPQLEQPDRTHRPVISFIR